MNIKTKEEEKEFSKLIETISKTLIQTMNVLDLKTHIEMTSITDGYRYKLRFDKEKI
jgi:ADP-dependent phosphofructokinase/glucokinase